MFNKKPDSFENKASFYGVQNCFANHLYQPISLGRFLDYQDNGLYPVLDISDLEGSFQNALKKSKQVKRLRSCPTAPTSRLEISSSCIRLVDVESMISYLEIPLQNLIYVTNDSRIRNIGLICKLTNTRTKCLDMERVSASLKLKNNSSSGKKRTLSLMESRKTSFSDINSSDDEFEDKKNNNASKRSSELSINKKISSFSLNDEIEDDHLACFILKPSASSGSKVLIAISKAYEYAYKELSKKRTINLEREHFQFINHSHPLNSSINGSHSKKSDSRAESQTDQTDLLKLQIRIKQLGSLCEPEKLETFLRDEKILHVLDFELGSTNNQFPLPRARSRTNTINPGKLNGIQSSNSHTKT